MKPILISVLALITFGFSQLTFAQQLHVVYLNQATDNYVNPLDVHVNPGDQVKFVTTGGNFNISIPNANTIFVGTPSVLKIKLDASHPESQIYQVQSVDSEIIQAYSVVCTSGGGQPTAPPRIIRSTSGQ
jgi:plastocyanin